MPRTSENQHARRQDLNAQIIIVMLVLAVFAPSMSFDFVFWDDEINILNNTHIQQINSENLVWMFTDFSYALRYSPLSWIGWAVNWAIGGAHPFGYHLGNLVLHVLNSLMIYRILRLLLERGMGEKEENVPRLIFCAAMGTLFWAIHPLRAEAVAWVTGRRYGQALFFALLSVIFYLRALEIPETTPRRNSLLIFSLFIFCACILTYPICVELPAVLLILDVFPFRRITRDASNRLWNDTTKRVILEKVPFFAASAAISIFTLWGRFHSGTQWGDPASLARLTIFARVMQVFYFLSFYLWKTIAPAGLLPYYTALVNFDPIAPRFILSVTAIGAISLFAFAARKRQPAIFWCWMAYLILMIAKSGFTESPHFTNDRYSYIGALPFSVLVSAGLAQGARRSGAAHKKWGLAPTAAILILAILCARQTFLWKDSEKLLSTMIARLGEIPFQNELQWRLGVVWRDAGKNREALECFDKALAIEPRDQRSRAFRGQLLLDTGEPARAADDLAEALKSNPDPAIRLSLVKALDQAGKTD
ncbi:tetratricopeptide repeat protein, partial [Candidatus Sumerlaeota bacterium]|nr:tetratricopeptide repeat protein [Candidatus Sumerlaeota bacterium]